MVRARRKRAKETRGDTRRRTGKLIIRSRQRKRRTAAGTSSAGWARRRTTGSSTRQGVRGEARRGKTGRTRTGYIRIGGRGAQERSRSSSRSKRLRRRNSNSQDVHKITVLRDWERRSHSVGCRIWSWIGRFSKTYACDSCLPKD